MENFTKNYTIYDVNTGAIKLTATSMLDESTLLPDEAILYEYCNDIKAYYIVDNTLVAKAPKPSAHHVFDYTTKQWIDPRTNATQWPIARRERDRLLLASDWTQLPDVPLATKEAWATYRQVLRDITLQSDPFNIAWPDQP